MSDTAPAAPVIEVNDTVTVEGEPGQWVIEEVIDGGRRYEASLTTSSSGPSCKTTHVTITTFAGERVRFVRKGNAVDDACEELFAYLDRQGGASVPGMRRS